MREIIFRGKRISDGEWMYGNHQNYCLQHIIRPNNSLDKYDKVDSKTIGQYTGMLDVNGNMIFEGDIVEYDVYCGFTYDEDVTEGRWQDKDNGVVEFKNGKFTNLPHKHNCEDYYYSYGTANQKIIGNIHDSEVVEDE